MQDQTIAPRRQAVAARAEAASPAEQKAVGDPERLEAVGRLASGVAHEFNNLLSVILSFTRFAREGLPADHPACEDLDEVLGAAERAQSLTSKLLTLARRKAFAPRLVRINELLEGMARMLRQLLPRDIELCMDLEPQLGLVRIDPGSFELVVVNLVANARDAMPGGGRLRLVTRRPRAQNEHLSSAPSLVFEVVDSGVGMNEDVCAHVFEPFFTTKQNGRGTGLGLATCWDLMAQAGGRMSVESKVGRGSTFRVLLPIAEARLEEAPELSSASSGVQRALRGETVLVVEDYPVVRQLARRVLEQAGYAVLEAESSARALELASDSARHIDLLLTDVVMPLMGGAELAEHVRKLHPRARILFVSGYGPDELRRREGTPTGAHFLQKPLTPEKLGRAVRLALDEVVSLGEKGS